MLRRFCILGSVLVALSVACSNFACSSETDGNELSGGAVTSGAGGSDTRHHPDPNGVEVGETDACDTLRTAVEERALALGCVRTTRACPSFLRALYQPDCMQYDQGSVQGCVDYFNGLVICEELIEGDCVLTTYPGTEPSGCP